jgi:hypothetical protein
MTTVSDTARSQRRNRAPIFVLGMQRGGTSQFLNVLRSHPATYWPAGELQALFRLRSISRKTLSRDMKKLIRYIPYLLTYGDVFSPHRPPKPGALAGWRGAWLDSALATASRDNRSEVSEFKNALVDRGLIDLESISTDRLVIKLMNYHVAFAPELYALYPDAKFIGILRSPFSLTESRMVRGAPMTTGTSIFNFVEEHFHKYEQDGLPITTFRFETLVESADATAARILEAADLPLDLMRGVCLEDRVRVTNKTGRVVDLDTKSGLYRFGEIQKHMRLEVNKKSLQVLDPAVKANIARLCAVGIERRGYVDMVADAHGSNRSAGL